MKRFKYIFRAILAVLLINLTTYGHAQNFDGISSPQISGQENRVTTNEPTWLDSVDISLLTCGPGQEVWSYYGHTALRIEDKVHGTDLAVNWGMFSFKQDFFILRFVFGLTDYQIGIYPMDDFIAEYAAEGRWVRQQRLTLTRTEKREILEAISENNQESNKTYRYNFFYDNCTTRARNMIIKHLGAHETDFKNTKVQSTYRTEIHQWNKSHRWARFGNDLLLGVLADRPIDKEEWEFLPNNLSLDFSTEARKDTALQQIALENASIPVSKSHYIKLVDSTFYLIPPQTEIVEAETITPYRIAIVVFILIGLLCCIEVIKRKNFWWLDTLLMIITGLPGLILLAMVFSQHPTVQTNFQILILNPANLLFVWHTAKRLCKGKTFWYYNVWGGLLALSLITQIWQDYAEGMTILALSLLLRYITRSTLLVLKRYKK